RCFRCRGKACGQHDTGLDALSRLPRLRGSVARQRAAIDHRAKRGGTTPGVLLREPGVFLEEHQKVGDRFWIADDFWTSVRQPPANLLGYGRRGRETRRLDAEQAYQAVDPVRLGSVDTEVGRRLARSGQFGTATGIVR